MNNQEYEKIIGILLDRIIKLEEMKQVYEDTLKPSLSPHIEVSKLKIFIQVFEALSGTDKHDVGQLNLSDELIRTGKFTANEAAVYIRKAIQNGQIYERNPNMLAKA